MFHRIATRFQGNPGGVQYRTSAPRRFGVGVFARLDDNSLGRRSYTWSGSDFRAEQPGDEWQTLGGIYVADPVAIAPAADPAVRIFARGTDNSLWVTWSNGTSWFGPEPAGGEFTSRICAVDSLLVGSHVFVRGLNNSIWHYYYHAGSRLVPELALEDLGGLVQGNPTAITTREGAIHIFVRGLDNGLWRKTWTGASWRDWHRIGAAGTLHENADPAVGVASVPRSLESQVFVVFQDPARRVGYISFNPVDDFYFSRTDELSPPTDINFTPACVGEIP